MENNPNYYAIIPANVRYDKDICPNAKLLYGEITALCNQTGICWAKNEYFSSIYGVSKTSISKWISQLVDKGYIRNELIYKAGTKEVLKRYLSLLTHPIEGKLKTPIEQKLNRPIEEKLKDNNTRINNTSINNTMNNIIDNKGDGFSFVEIINSEEEKKGKEKTSAKKEKPKTEIENQALEVLNFLNENRRKWLNATRDFSPDSKAHFQFITARLKTYSVDDLKGVIAVKFMQWHKDHKMSKYLTPDTLFNETNCAKYIQEVDIAKLNPNYQNEQRNLQNKDSRPNSRENIAAIYAEVDRVFGNRK